MTPSTGSAPARTKDRDMVIARRQDVRQLAEMGPPPGQLPHRHGGRHDPRYLSPSSLRTVLAFVIDLVLHAGVGAAAGFAVATTGGSAGKAVLVGVGTFLVLSLLDRVVLQRICQATVGKLVTGLVVIREADGRPPTGWMLVKRWLLSFWILLTIANW